MNDLLRRQAATMATHGRYFGKPFGWAAGVTCVHLIRFHLRQMGHRPAPLPRVRSALAARRALTERGWQTCGDMLDAQVGLARIPAAAMLPGDVALLDSDDEGGAAMGALFVCVGPHKLMGWREDAPGCVVLDVSFADIAAAWRA